MKKLYVVIAACLVLAGCSNEASEASEDSDGSSDYSVTGSTKPPKIRRIQALFQAKVQRPQQYHQARPQPRKIPN